MAKHSAKDRKADGKPAKGDGKPGKPETRSGSDAQERALSEAAGTLAASAAARRHIQHSSAEHARLAESPMASSPWRLWGPYVSGRQWGTVREDYSADGDAWSYFPFEQSHARAYRWGEDGLGAICDRLGFLNFSVALWNGRDPILKERLYGLTNGQGNHGEDIKEYWWAVDGTPTHSWMSWLYRYPQAEFPYEQLRRENAARNRDQREYELADTGVLDQNRFFDVTVDYAKASTDDICIVISATNHGPEAAPLDILPQVWFRNTWAWGRDDRRPSLQSVTPAQQAIGDLRAVHCRHEQLGSYLLAAEGTPQVLVCENESNDVALFGSPANPAPFCKDGINRRVVNGDLDAVAPELSADGTAPTGTKAAFWYHFDAVPAGETVQVRLRLAPELPTEQTFGPGFAAVVADRRSEADEFYDLVIPPPTDDEARAIARQAFAGLLWGKQLYRYRVKEWLDGDPGQPAPPPDRRLPGGRNVEWQNIAIADVMSMPDDWEYPWFASWDLAFHCVALAHVDPAFAKEQLVLLCREWSMHPDGQLPAYEWSFGDANPPVHIWAAWRIYLIDGSRDRDFLERIFTKSLLNFGWWVNRKDPDGSGLFEGGFLGMDNIGLFNRSMPLPPGYRLEESDATSWMGFYCLQMLTIAIELALSSGTGGGAWDDLATKFLEHFLSIADAMQQFGSQQVQLWDEADGFFYDVLVHPDGGYQQLQVRSMVGLLPLLAVATAQGGVAQRLPDFSARLAWLQRRRPDLMRGLVAQQGVDPFDGGVVLGDRPLMLALVDAEQLRRLLTRMFDEQEFLSPHGLRSLSASYRTPFNTVVEGQQVSIDYEPGESRTGLFGGNSNWRGPVWLPVNILLADAMRAFGAFHGDEELVAGYTGTGAADEIDRRIIGLFRVGDGGTRPCDGSRIEASSDPLWRDHLTFSEYFDGDTGEGLGATHQTGWTALVAHLICSGDR
ncbi:hypothetical protein SAMN05892883_0897 [Jatrophihabitans sp. GAS493]|nr:hypothetical protein [Jatrophihabitans sp. GAS493]SOD71366.1 hypothetical protein SAMN05892883_0897 [Jatrophihabitans sp. GAS493]